MPHRCFRYRFAVVALLAVGLVLDASTAGAAETHSGSRADVAAAITAGVARATLKNGLKVIVVPNHLSPAVTAVMNYDVGSRSAPKGFPGTAHAQEHMMFRGAKALSGSQISAIAAAMGGQFNADTQTEVTQYYFTVPAADLGVALHLQAQRMKNVTNSEAAWKKERGAIEQEVGRDLSDPAYVAYKKLRRKLFAGTPYAYDALGTQASFDKTTAKLLKHFYNTWYTPNNATLIIAGDVQPAQVLDKVRALFSGIPAKKVPKAKPVKLSPVKPKAIRMPTDASYGLTYLAFRGPGTNAPKRYAAAKVLANILNNPRGALYSQLVAKGHALGIQFAIEGLREASIAFAAAAFPAGADAHKLVGQMRAILAKIVKKGVTPAQVKTAQRQLVTQAAADQDSISGQAMQWSQAVAIEKMPSPAAQLKNIEHVTAADVNALARQMLEPDHSVLTVLTPKSSGQATSASGGFGGGESFTPSHVAKVKLPRWAAKQLAHITAPKPPVKLVKTTLANGMTLITVPTQSTHAIHVYGHIRNEPDLEAPKGKEGVDAVLSQLLDYGTRKHSRVAYQAALDAIGAQASAGTHFSLTVLPAHFTKGLDLLAENELHPALPKSAFKMLRRQTAAAVAGRLTSPDFHAEQALKAALYPKNDPSLTRHPRLGQEPAIQRCHRLLSQGLSAGSGGPGGRRGRQSEGREESGRAQLRRLARPR